MELYEGKKEDLVDPYVGMNVRGSKLADNGYIFTIEGIITDIIEPLVTIKDEHNDEYDFDIGEIEEI